MPQSKRRTIDKYLYRGYTLQLIIKKRNFNEIFIDLSELVVYCHKRNIALCSSFLALILL